MKKIVVAVAAFVLLMITLCSCATVDCYVCGRKVTESSAVTGEIYGNEYTVCRECLKYSENFLAK